MRFEGVDVWARRAAYVADFLPSRLLVKGASEAFAPANIALCKYWGKRDAVLNLPVNGSLSISLGALGTRTCLFRADQDEMVLNGRALLPEDKVFRRTFAFVDLFRQGLDVPLRIESVNSVATAAGLASSASAFAALVLALNDFFTLDLSRERLSALARLGSGSAARSLWQGFVRWDRGIKADGSDSFARVLPSSWQALRVALLEVDFTEKAVGSSEGMQHTVKTSPLFASWEDCATRDLEAMEEAVLGCDFDRLGALAEGNMLAMHATMMAARPALFYLKSASFALLERVRALRAEGLSFFCTADAGANVKLLYLAKDEDLVLKFFPSAVLVNPFVAVDG